MRCQLLIIEDVRDEREGKKNTKCVMAKHGRTGTDHGCGMWRQARMSKIAAVDKAAPAVAQVDLSDIRSRQSAGVLWSARGWGHVAVWGVGRVGSRGPRKQPWLGTCMVKDQLRPEGSPRRIYNARVRVMEWSRFKWRKQSTAGKVRQAIKGGGFQVGALRGQGCTNRERSESEISGSTSVLLCMSYDTVCGKLLHIMAKAIDKNLPIFSAYIKYTYRAPSIYRIFPLICTFCLARSRKH